MTDEPRDYNYVGLPLEEVTHELQDRCKNQFDVLIPRDAVPVPQLGPDGTLVVAEPIDLTALVINLRLKGVSVIEVFQAMNMQFELERKPFRWELVMNGHRPVAALHLLESEPPSAAPAGSAQAQAGPQTVSRSVIYVGNLLGPKEAGGMKPEALSETLEETARQTFPGSSTRKIQFHPGAELFVLSGTDEEVRFMKDVLQALTEKANYQRKRDAAGVQEPAGKR